MFFKCQLVCLSSDQPKEKEEKPQVREECMAQKNNKVAVYINLVRTDHEMWKGKWGIV